MKNKAAKQQLSDREMHLIEQLRRHPEMMERFQSILELASSGDGPLKTADEVEELLIEAVRKLGHTTLSQWAVGAEERVSQELKEQQSGVLSRKKNAEMVVCLWAGGGAGPGVAHGSQELRASLAPAGGDNSSRPFATA